MKRKNDTLNSFEMFSEIQFDHKQQYEQREIIDINGLCCLYPFIISMSLRNKSTLFQQDTTWTRTDFEWIKPASSIDINYLPLLILLLMIKLNFRKHDFNEFSV